MERLTAWILNDRIPSLGVTEPGAIALAAATARKYVTGIVTHVTVRMTSGLYKNAYTCGIPNTTKKGAYYSAALGVIAGDPDKGLLALEGIHPADVQKAEQMIAEEKVEIIMTEVTSHLHLEAEVTSATDTATVVIDGTHTNIVRIDVNGETVLENDTIPQDDLDYEEGLVGYTLADIVHYCNTVPFSEIACLKEGYGVNLALTQVGLESDRAVISKGLVAMNGGRVFSQNTLGTAHVLTGAALEARVIGLNRPAMSITGSGAHGILCTMPLYAAYKCQKLDAEMLCRATALSYLITMYLKAYSGRLSAFCGCGIAGGTGMAAALTYLMGGGLHEISCTIYNMASSITGMICDGGNTGCVLKAMTALDCGYRSAMLGLRGIGIDRCHGINGKTVEETLQNMGKIADPGMQQTERVIVDILESKKEWSDHSDF
jgi:L-cysteine desulfidase